MTRIESREQSPGAAAFQRARRPEQREQRREAILDAAGTLLREMPASEVSLRELSRRVGLSKSNVVRYFETREAVFLELLDRSIGEWLDALEDELPPVPGPDGPPVASGTLARAWAGSLARRPLLCELWSILAAVLERNVSVESVRAFKLREADHRARLARMAGDRLPGLDEPAAMELTRISVVLTAGLWPFANPSPAVVEATGDPCLAEARVNFGESLGTMLHAALKGLLCGHVTP
ncbi:TetR family transcriptional regulator [Streptomyces sp. NPDC046977]|uniref:TetR/AcrR family transcriptional regulator n=1 Tax=Streptomyces sp. NPDC046977 TaxID=3154703 RepID=UPI0033F5B181